MIDFYLEELSRLCQILSALLNSMDWLVELEIQEHQNLIDEDRYLDKLYQYLTDKCPALLLPLAEKNQLMECIKESLALPSNQFQAKLKQIIRIQHLKPNLTAFGYQRFQAQGYPIETYQQWITLLRNLFKNANNTYGRALKLFHHLTIAAQKTNLLLKNKKNFNFLRTCIVKIRDELKHIFAFYKQYARINPELLLETSQHNYCLNRDYLSF